MNEPSGNPGPDFEERLRVERERLQAITLLSLGFGARLKAERERLLRTQQVMADLACISRSTYKRIERGAAPMGTDALYRLGSSGVDIRAVMFGPAAGPIEVGVTAPLATVWRPKNTTRRSHS